ncbi:MAG: hypothetical protein KGQ67_17950, partial [Betaproteobacteria bacterium]|nr:hypothetical protein [Betaproteobacteria bacterium]
MPKRVKAEAAGEPLPAAAPGGNATPPATALARPGRAAMPDDDAVEDDDRQPHMIVRREGAGRGRRGPEGAPG